MILVDTSVWIHHLRNNDPHLLASTQLSGNTRLWTQDKRLLAAATHLNLAVFVQNV